MQSLRLKRTCHQDATFLTLYQLDALQFFEKLATIHSFGYSSYPTLKMLVCALHEFFTPHALNKSIGILPTSESFKEFITNINFYENSCSTSESECVCHTDRQLRLNVANVINWIHRPIGNFTFCQVSCEQHIKFIYA